MQQESKISYVSDSIFPMIAGKRQRQSQESGNGKSSNRRKAATQLRSQSQESGNGNRRKAATGRIQSQESGNAASISIAGKRQRQSQESGNGKSSNRRKAATENHPIAGKRQRKIIQSQGLIELIIPEWGSVLCPSPQFLANCREKETESDGPQEGGNGKTR